MTTATKLYPGLTVTLKEELYDLRYVIQLDFLDEVTNRVFASIHPEFNRDLEPAGWYLRFHYHTSNSVMDFARHYEWLSDAIQLVSQQYSIIYKSRFDALYGEQQSKQLYNSAMYQIHTYFNNSDYPDVDSPVLLDEALIGKHKVFIEVCRENYTIGDVPRIRHYFKYIWGDGTVSEYTLHILRPVVRYSFSGESIQWLVQSGLGDLDDTVNHYYSNLEEAVVNVNSKLRTALDCYTEQMPHMNSTRQLLSKAV